MHAGVVLGESFITGRSMSIGKYRELSRAVPRDYREELRMIAAMASARVATNSDRHDFMKIHAAGRAESRARRLGLPDLASATRVVRRYISWNATTGHDSRVLVRALRANVLVSGARRLSAPAYNILWTSLATAQLSRPRGRLVAKMLAQGRGQRGLPIDVASRLYGPQHIQYATTAPKQARAYRLLEDQLAHNRFSRVARGTLPQVERLTELRHSRSLGLLHPDWSGRSHFALVPGAPGFLPRVWPTRGEGVSHIPTRKTRTAAEDAAALGAMQGKPLDPADRALLQRAVAKTEMWSRRLILSMSLTLHCLGRGEVKRAGAGCVQGRVAYRGFMGLRARRQITSMPPALVDYEDLCRRVLGSMEPPHKAGDDPVRVLARVAGTWPRRRRTPPHVTIDALDAVIVAGRSKPGRALEARVVEQLARMLSARVLFHRTDEGVQQLEAQEAHTLSSWTLHELMRETGVKTHRIRRRPEFWRPEQHRPGGLLGFPVGSGRACLARDAAFSAKEAAAIRTVLRFLSARTAPAAAPPAPLVAPKPSRPQRSGLAGDSPAWRRVLDEVWRLAPTDCSILITGETGTGTELVARAVHQNSHRAGHAMVSVNCGALNRDTLLSELFGHVRGAFTGAENAREGLIRDAHRGTLFLDELGDMPPEMQVALLRAVESGRVRPVGGIREVPADVRIVSATNLDLEDLKEAGLFRRDLFHRLAVFEIRLPPLRERLEDLPALVASILEGMDNAPSLPADVLAVLAGYGWPGNIRELKNVLQAAALLSDGSALDAEVVRHLLSNRGRSAPPARARVGPRTERILQLLDDRWRGAPQLADALGVSTRTINRELGRLQDRSLVKSSGHGRARQYTAT